MAVPMRSRATLAIGRSDDQLEHQASRAAEQALGGPEAARRPSMLGGARDGGHMLAHSRPAPASVERVAGAGGRALDASLRQDMGQRFGYDFSRVRVHTDPAAAQSAREINAHAYTVGHNVVFGAGRFQPDAPQGRRLIAHELAHIVQLGAGADAATVRRFESPEHQDFGDQGGIELATFLSTPEGQNYLKRYQINPALVAGMEEDPYFYGKKITVGELTLSPGDVIALIGDFYRSPHALMTAPPAEVRALLAAIQREREGKLTGAQANQEYEDITRKYRKPEDTFLQLAKVNNPHFTPGNRAEWTKLHLEAIETARQAPLRPAALEEALLIDAGGGHYLTDAFAAGHLFNKQELEVQIVGYLSTHRLHASNPEMQSYLALSSTLGLMPNLVLKNIHDRLNVEGIEVSNKKGMAWRTYGDAHLKDAPETRRIGALAIYLSRQHILRAAKRGAPAPDLAEVLDLLPDADSVARASAKASSYIPAAADDVAALIYRQRGALKAGLGSSIPVIGSVLGSVIEMNIAAIGDPGRERQFLQEEQRRGPGSPPPVLPQFTIFSWK